jgi:CBS domain-containing protein
MSSEKRSPRSAGSVWPTLRRIAQVMQPGVVVLRRSDSLVNALAALRAHDVRYAAVMSGHEIEGVLAERDLDALTWMIRSSKSRSHDWMNELVVEDVMRTPPLLLSPEASLAHAGRLLREGARDCVVVVSEGRPVGVVTRDELMGAAPEPTIVPITQDRPGDRPGAAVRRPH